MTDKESQQRDSLDNKRESLPHGGVSTETIDLASLFPKDVTDSGSFEIQGEIWTTTFGRVIQALPIPVLLIDQSRKVIAANQACRKIGAGYEMMVGKPFSRLFADPRDALECESAVSTVFSTRKTSVWEALLKIDKNSMWGRLTFRSIRMKDQRCLMVLVEDLSLEKKQHLLDKKYKNDLEKRVKERTEQLRKLNEELHCEIADRKRSEEALRRSEERFRQIAESTGEWIWEVDAEGTYRYCSSAVESILGYSPAELVGKKHFYDLFAPEVRRSLKETVLSAFERREPFRNLVNPNVHKNAEIRILEASGSPIQDNEGNLLGYLGVDKDITDREKAEEALRESEKRYRMLFESAGDCVYILDAEGEQPGQIVSANPAAARMHGYTVEEMLSLNIADLDTPESGRNIQARIERLLKRETVKEEVTHRRKDGSVFSLDINAQLLVIGGHKYVLATDRDITERKCAEKALRLSEERYRRLFEDAPLMYVITRNEEDVPLISDCNELFLHSVGYTREEVQGKSLADFYSPGSRAELLERGGYSRALAGEFLMGERELVRRDGTRIPTLLYTAPEVDSSGQVTGTRAMFVDITEIKKAGEALRKSEERLELALQGANLGLWDWHVQNGQAIANERAAEMIGYSLDEIEQSFGFWESLLHPDDHRRALEKVFNHLADPTDYYEDEYRVRHKSGDWTWILSRGKVTERDSDGRPLRITGTFLDITDKKLAESQASEANELREQIVSASPMGIAVYGGDGQCISANEALGRIVGADKERLLIQNFRNLSSWKDSGLLADAELVLSSGTNNQREVNFTSTFGKNVWVNARMARITSGGEPHLLVVINDITERRTAEDALKFEREQLLSLFESINEVILVIDPITCEILFANKFTEDLYGKQLIGGTCYERLNGFDTPCGHCHNDKIVQLQGQPYQWEYSNPILKRDFLATDRMIRWPNGHDVKFQIAIDITERKESQQEQDHLKAQLFQAQKMESIGTLAGGIAHDFNNLLTVILGFSELIISEKEEGDKEYEDLTKIIHAARTAGDMVQQILAFSRKSETKPRPINLNKQVDQLKKMLSRLIPKTIEVEMSLDPGLPTVNADPTQIEQILINMAVNARDAMPNGGRLLVETRTVLLDEKYCRFHLEAAQGRHALIVVTDTGIGIDGTTMDRIFEPFYTTKKPGQGTGLGLAMVYGIVKSHGGHITCESELGRGTTFNIFLPAHQAEGEADVTVSDEFSALGAGTILLVDDEEFVRSLGQRILQKAGYTVITATNGEEAVKVYKQEGNKIALVILDLIMPVMDGSQCLEEILRLDPGARVLIASGYSPDGTIRETLEGGAKGFVGKPYNLKQLLKTVRDALNEK